VMRRVSIGDVLIAAHPSNLGSRCVDGALC
jgi:hypothetical protein